MARVIVVGTGIAGLIAALRASERHDVTIVTKAELAESSTRYAQGGIAAAMFADDSVESHVADTLAAGAGVSDRRAVEVLCAEGPARIRDLERLGVEFDLDGLEFARGHEAAHSARRVLHAGGDATGLAIETALIRAVRAAGIPVIESAFMSDLAVESGRVVGVHLVVDGATTSLDADAVVLASGGAGQLYRHTTNPAVATGDGVAAAWRAGAVIADPEFYQFHPTSLALPGGHLVSEAVRGEGAVLLDDEGRRFMLDVHPDAELAPRDVVARGIAARMAQQDGGPVMLDATGFASGFLAARFPSITRVVAAAGLDWTREPIPVTPAAHYWMGGIATDLRGRSSLPGLFAVGEVANTGVHGANRLASNSLLESLVFAWRLDLGDDSTSTDEPAPRFDAARVDLLESAATRSAVRDDIRDLMWSNVGLYRDRRSLERAAASFASWRVEGGAADAEALESRNLLELARIVTAAALARAESRGAHWRTDHPSPSAAWARRTFLERAGADAVGGSPATIENEVVAC